MARSEELRRKSPIWVRLVAMIGLVSLTIALFLGIGEWYLRATMNGNKTTVLDPALFEEGSLSRIDTMIKRYSSDSIYQLESLQNGTLLIVSENRLESKESSTSNRSLSILDISTNQVTRLVEDNVGHVVVAPEGTGILYDTVRDNKLMTVWYDVAGRRELAVWDNWSSWPLMIDERHSLEITDQSIQIHNLETNEIQSIASLKDMNPMISKNGKQYGAYKKRMLPMSLTPDKSNLFVPFYVPQAEQGEAIIYTMNLQTKAEALMAIPALRDIYYYLPLSENELIVSARAQDTEGLYLTGGEGEPKLLKQGSYSYLSYNTSRHTMAYASRSEGRWKVMVAKLEDSKGNRSLTDEFTVYDNLGYIQSLEWSTDGHSLLVITDENTGSNVYQFHMK